jgi:hypothetical protein
MPESIHAPHPVKQPDLTRKFPLTDMPTGLMAALVTRLARLGDRVHRHEDRRVRVPAVGRCAGQVAALAWPDGLAWPCQMTGLPGGR